jgi:diketogulonate reductase-like aldo/keto reductase
MPIFCAAAEAIMRYRKFGSTGRDVSIIGLGTWQLDESDRVGAAAALRAGLDLGANHIDTAEMYGNAELIVAEALKGRRDEAFVVSKVLPSNATRSGTRTACERSLRRLGTDRLDCYLLHWRGSVPLEDTFATFADLQREGKILSWGVSNFDEDDLDDARAASAGLGGGAVCNQVLYHLEQRAIEHAVLPWCESEGVAITAYSPFGSGDFPRTGTPGMKMLEQVAKAHGVSVRQVALAFLVRHPSVFAIPKSGNAAHVADNVAAGDLLLSDDEIAMIDAAFPLGRKPRSLPMI